LIDDRKTSGLGLSEVVDGNLCLYGVGPVPARLMVIAECPSEVDVSSGVILSDKRGLFLKQAFKQIGFDSSEIYFTNYVKYMPKNGKIKAADVRASKDLLWAEIERVNPEIVVTAGTHVIKELLGKSATLGNYRGMLIPVEDKPIKVFPMYNPGYLFRMPEAMPAWQSDMNILERILGGGKSSVEPPQNTLIHSVEELQAFTKFIFSTYEKPYIVIDCEWHGNNYMEEQAYIRTVQLGYDDNKVATVEFYNEKQELIVTKATSDGMLPYTNVLEDERKVIKDRMFQVLGVLLENPKTSVAGHNVRADGRWLLWNGVDIRETTVYDTMVLEHTIDSRGPFGLSALTMKYTAIGRYDKDVETWKADNPALYKDGYGLVPGEILLPYGAFDVEAPRQIMKKQQADLQPYYIKRGEYPSLAEADMECAKILYEMENEGLLIDKEQFNKFQEMYSEAQNKVEVTLSAAATDLGMPDFNPRAVEQVRKLLFDTLDMTPIKTTKGSGNKNWNWVMNQDYETQKNAAPSTDKDTLSILADTPGAHPIVKVLADFRKVSYVCSNWLVPEEKAALFNTESKGGGLLSKIWPDGRLHARFSQLKETGRLGSAKPNVQNWMKRAEGELKRIVGPDLLAKHFGAEASFPTLKSVVIPRPNHVFIEADWKQAEMFTLARLAGDKVMDGALNTPGKDLHDLTAISAFKLQVLDSTGAPVPEEYLLNLALKDVEKYGTCEGHDFEKFQKTLFYMKQSGEKLSRSDFKDQIRVSAKSLNFGCNIF